MDKSLGNIDLFEVCRRAQLHLKEELDELLQQALFPIKSPIGDFGLKENIKLDLKLLKHDYKRIERVCDNNTQELINQKDSYIPQDFLDNYKSEINNLLKEFNNIK